MRIAIAAVQHFSFVVSLEILIRSEAPALPFDENFIITATLLPNACMQRVRGLEFYTTCTTIELTSNPNSKSVIITRVVLWTCERVKWKQARFYREKKHNTISGLSRLLIWIFLNSFWRAIIKPFRHLFFPCTLLRKTVKRFSCEMSK